MKWCVRILSLVVILLLLPEIADAQATSRIRSMHEVLAKLYTDMMPLCESLINVGRGIAGFAATWFIGSRVWGHIARAEPVDFYPLFRPFVIGFCILNFSLVIKTIEFVFSPTEIATRQMVTNSDAAVKKMLAMKEEAIKKTAYWQMYVGPTGDGDRAKWYKYNYGTQSEGFFRSIGNDIKFAFAKFHYNLRNSIKAWMSEVLQLLFEAAALCINTIRTFFLIILAILGPIVFGLSVFDGFQHTLLSWLARYINIFMWLPVCNIFGAIMGKIQENMLAEDLKEIATHGDTYFGSTDTGYLIFLVIGIAGYFTVPSVANYIVHAGGHGLLRRTNSMAGAAYGYSTSKVDSAMDYFNEKIDKMKGDMTRMPDWGHPSGGSGGDTSAGQYQKDKITGQNNNNV